MNNFSATHIVETPWGDISLNNTHWKETRILFPRKCIFTHKWIMPFSKVVQGKRTAGMPGQRGMASFTYWTTPKEFTIQSLKDKV